VEEFAAGVIRVVNANMEKAVRVVSIERGYDPREFALVAFGGAGAMHACELAQALRIPKVIVPAYPGGLSALGILISDVVKDHSRTILMRVRELPRKELERLYGELQSGVLEELRKEGWQGKIVIEKSCDVRYRGQGYELNLSFGSDMLQRFHAEHNRRYGYSSPEREVEIVTVRLRARVASPQKLAGMKVEEKIGKLEQASAQVWFAGKKHKTPILPRGVLKQGKLYRGPAIVTEYSATTVIPPGMRFQMDKVGNLIIGVSAERTSGSV
jgi:N-methylhydantoinase A